MGTSAPLDAPRGVMWCSSLSALRFSGGLNVGVIQAQRAMRLGLIGLSRERLGAWVAPAPDTLGPSNRKSTLNC